jgi:phosphoglucomutase
MSIPLETPGWRTVIADDSTLAGVRRATPFLGGRSAAETPVGFKFIGELINEDKIILGGEASAGLSIKGHHPEKDGILACLLAAEAIAPRGESLTQQLNARFARVVRVESARIGVRVTPEFMRSLKERLAQDPTQLGGRSIAQTNRLEV